MDNKEKEAPTNMEFAMHVAMHAYDQEIIKKNSDIENPFEKIIALSENSPVKPYLNTNPSESDLDFQKSLKTTLENIQKSRQSFNVAQDIAINHIKPK